MSLPKRSHATLLMYVVASLLSCLPSAAHAQQAPSPTLAEVLAKAAESDEHLGELLRPVTSRVIRDEATADRMIACIRSWTLDEALERSGEVSQLAVALGLLQNASDGPIADRLRREVDPLLLEWTDQIISTSRTDRASELIYLLQWLAMGRTNDAVDRLVAAARAGFAADEPLWPVAFDPYSDDHPTSRRLIKELSDPLPKGMIGLGLLDCSNGLALAEAPIAHPFDRDSGVEALAEWLKIQDDVGIGAAQSATAALPFIKHRRRNELLQVAVNHPHSLIRAEAGWALVKLGDDRGFRLLLAACRDVRYSVTAQLYMEELGGADRIPAEVKDADFAARAEICHFLGLPAQVGAPPSVTRVVDSRVLFWPPTGDRRRMTVVRFAYKDEEGKLIEEGVGLVGSLTVWLPELTNPEMASGDVLAWHCLHELRLKRDPRATGVDDLEGARRLLQSGNEPR